MFSTKRRQSNESFTETKNVAAWESLILDLSKTRREDDEGDNNMLDSDDNSEVGGFVNKSGGGDDPSPRISNDDGSERMEQKLHIPQLFPVEKKKGPESCFATGPISSSSSGSRISSKSSTNNDITTFSSQKKPPATLESQSYLSDWIAYYSNKYPPRANQFDTGKKMNDSYILNAAQIALSLAKNLGSQFDDKHHEDDGMASKRPSISCDDIILKNVLVTNVGNGEAVIESTKYSSNVGTTNIHRSASNIERQQVLALGMILYELFTQGSPPPRRIQQSLKSTRSVLSFGTSLRISDSDDDDDRLALGGDRRKNEDGSSLDETDHSAQEEFVRKTRRRQSHEVGKEESVPILLKLAGVPCSICRLISDMLSNRDDADFGRLFQYDKSISCFADVVMDLEQMIDQPKDFLYDKIRLSAKPAVRNKLYSRQKELEQGLELAGRSASWYYQDDDEDRKAGKEYDEARAIDALSSPVKQEVLLVSGQPGSGKSCLVNELIAQLTSYGWESLHCKFDQIGRRQPLSTIASAFDRYFSSLSATESENSRECNGNVTLALERIRANLLKAFDEESFSILFHLIPNLRRVLSNDDNSANMKQVEYEYDESAVISSKIRLHNLFCELVKAISSSWDTPMLLFLDDLHWADSASLELIAFIINEMGANLTTDSVTAVRGTTIFIIGTVRTNEVEKSIALSAFLKQIRGCYNVTVTDMALQDLSPADVNVMISEALCYSKRLTRSLAGIVHHKSEGNPFFVKEFLNDLTVENLLVYSFSGRLWDWDEELIESRTISDGVAEILTRKLSRLPKDQLLGLVMLSCFGSDVSFEVLTLIKSFHGNSDIMNSLDCVAQARFVERTDEKYRFVHDMILHAAQQAVDEEERTAIMKELMQALVPHGYSDDTILFIVVNLISRVDANNVHDSETRLLYAQLNLTAAKKATATTDFASASSCVNCGISFLSAGHWENSYRLSLELFSQSILVEWALGNIEQMMTRLDDVFNNANDFQDTLRAARIKLTHLRMTGNCLNEAFAYGFQILEHLGETFPATPANETIVQEVLATKQLVTGSLNESKLKSLSEITDSTKKEAMAILEELLICSYQSHSIFFPLIACRMVRITLQHGLAKSSCIGLVSVAISLVTVFSNFSEGYSIAKTSLSIAGSDKRVLCYIMVSAFGMINIWKEPIQAILPQLKDAYNMSLKYGLIDNALAAGMLHAYRSFFTGSLLKALNEEVSLFMRNNKERHKRKLMHLCMRPVSNGIECLSGSSGPRNVGEFITEEHLAEALHNKEFTVCESMLAIKLMCSFIFRKPDEVNAIARQYLELFERQGGASAQFINIYRIFYGGLLSLHFYRESRDRFWMDRAAHAIQKMERWYSESDWNFENKLFLLQAERHYAFGEIDRAAEKYKLAEESSKTHRFLHEEALACELAAEFHQKAGNKNFVAELIDRAVKCYQTWGAERKVESLLFSP